MFGGLNELIERNLLWLLIYSFAFQPFVEFGGFDYHKYKMSNTTSVVIYNIHHLYNGKGGNMKVVERE